MTDNEEFHRKAREFEAKAETAYNTTVKQAYLELARYWREIADHSERAK